VVIDKVEAAKVEAKKGPRLVTRLSDHERPKKMLRGYLAAVPYDVYWPAEEDLDWNNQINSMTSSHVAMFNWGNNCGEQSPFNMRGYEETKEFFIPENVRRIHLNFSNHGWVRAIALYDAFGFPIMETVGKI